MRRGTEVGPGSASERTKGMMRGSGIGVGADEGNDEGVTANDQDGCWRRSTEESSVDQTGARNAKAETAFEVSDTPKANWLSALCAIGRIDECRTEAG